MSLKLDGLRGAFAIRSHARASRAEIVSFRDRQLRKLQHAYYTVPSYRAHWDEHGVHPDGIQSAVDMPLLPTVTKTHFRDAPEIERVAAGLDPEMLIPAVSSGSSGRPFMIRRSWLEHNVLYLARVRALRSYGITRATTRSSAVRSSRSSCKRSGSA